MNNTKLVLLGAYGNEPWENLEEISKEEENKKEKIQEEFKNSLGPGWVFRWVLRG